MTVEPDDVCKRDESGLEFTFLIGMCLILGTIVVAWGCAFNLEVHQAAQRAPLELSTQDYIQLQTIAKRSPAGREHLKEWVKIGPILNRDYSNKAEILGKEADAYAATEQKAELLAVKRNIAELSYDKPY
ncbi:MAG: hypothetical protein Q7S87_16345 [Agitococcus sp.]|nr:hypothetical protein [Agitococcus sp.]MDO9176949.1 hypothetical protein [Agitococcus sp.]